MTEYDARKIAQSIAEDIAMFYATGGVAASARGSARGIASGVILPTIEKLVAELNARIEQANRAGEHHEQYVKRATDIHRIDELALASKDAELKRLREIEAAAREYRDARAEQADRGERYSAICEQGSDNEELVGRKKLNLAKERVRVGLEALDAALANPRERSRTAEEKP